MNAGLKLVANGCKYKMGGDLANGFDARLQTQFISSLDWRHNNPPFLYLLLAFRFLLLILKSINYELH